MTPLSTLEAMPICEAAGGFDEQFRPDVWTEAREMIEKAVHFDFRIAVPLHEHVDWGWELFEKGVFRLPYETVYYTVPHLSDGAFVARHVPASVGQMQSLTIFIVEQTPAGCRWSESPFGRLRIRGSCYDDAVCETDAVMRDMETCREGIADIMGWARDPTFRTAAENEHHLLNLWLAIPFVIGATTMLASKDVEQEIERPSEKLNEKRLRRGELPLPERRIITVKPYARAVYERALEDHKAGRMSPRMHLRRGHFRTIYQGSEQERVIPVAPCVVNAGEGGEAIAKAYRVQDNKAEAQP